MVLGIRMQWDETESYCSLLLRRKIIHLIALIWRKVGIPYMQWGGKQSSYRSTLWSAEFLYSSFYNLCLLFSTCPVKTSFYSASWTILGQPMATKNSHSEEGLQLVTIISALILAGMYCPELQWHSVVSAASLCYSWGTCQCKQCRVYSDIPVTDVMQPILQVYMLEWSTSSMNPQFT